MKSFQERRRGEISLVELVDIFTALRCRPIGREVEEEKFFHHHSMPCGLKNIFPHIDNRGLWKFNVKLDPNHRARAGRVSEWGRRIRILHEIIISVWWSERSKNPWSILIIHEGLFTHLKNLCDNLHDLHTKRRVGEKCAYWLHKFTTTLVVTND